MTCTILGEWTEGKCFQHCTVIGTHMSNSKQCIFLGKQYLRPTYNTPWAEEWNADVSLHCIYSTLNVTVLLYTDRFGKHLFTDPNELFDTSCLIISACREIHGLCQYSL
jgi:hypothetical protein